MDIVHMGVNGSLKMLKTFLYWKQPNMSMFSHSPISFVCVMLFSEFYLFLNY